MFSPVVEIKKEWIESKYGRCVKQYNVSIKKTRNTTYFFEPERMSCLPVSLNDINKSLPRRWRCLLLWSISCLDDFRITFCLLKEYILSFIDKFFNREGRKVQKLQISYDYKESDALQVDSWIRFALKHSAEELDLRFSNGVQSSVEGFYKHYKLPHSLFRSKSLTNLTLSFCDLNLPSSIHLSSLKRLSLELIDISPDAITSLTSRCPLLEYLSFGGCNKLANLDIVISNPNLKFLEIWDDMTTFSETKFMIDAPNLHSLGFHVCLPRANYCLKNLPNLAKVSFYDFDPEVCLGKVCGEGDRNQLARLLGDIHHVKEIRLCSFFIQGLSIKEVQKLHFTSINATCIELETKLTKWELPGISYMLKSSPKLETLIIKPGLNEIWLGYDLKDKFGFDMKDFWKYEDFDFSSHLQNLKTVEIHIYVGSYKLGSVDEVLKRIENSYVQFVRFLLKNAISLEIMNIDCGEKNTSLCNDYGSLLKLMKMFAILPRASARCGVYIL
ncbi:hypothetical protein AQUCO_00200597v1 [Aquilegia coerulea]|uniref:F-box/LRR-repeat protein 15/At3g58940/PEG3-like LRR domain-containing protein n=1 Tax=Aquilegia coerulea TaxID=218851 RepID=A0A2G5F3T3_AQUCA|nr:hypothetical protein AQUCO_00200597v1 [Aquilegia coerulea]